MRDQLIRYVDLLFAGASDSGDVKQEILQNTLDRYDDLIAQGKAPQAAYSLAISGIGDLSEILAREPETPRDVTGRSPQPVTEEKKSVSWKKVVRTIAIFLYIICIIPLLVLDEMGLDTIGLVGTISIVAVATVGMIVSADEEKAGKKKQEDQEERDGNLTPRQEMRKAVKKVISTVGLAAYLLVSISTGAWYITWLIFPMIGAVQGIVTACMDLKEAKDHEI